MPTLFLKLLSAARRDEDGYHLQVAWEIRESDGARRGGGVTDFRGLSDLIDPSADWLQDPNNIVVLVPTEQVLSMTCQVPGRSTGQIRRALPFVVEEFVASDIETLHLAAGTIRRGEPVAVSLVDRVLLEDWLACLDELGIHPGHMLCEAELLPQSGQGVTVLLDGPNAVVKSADQAASIDRENLPVALAALADVEEVSLINGDLDDLERSQLDAELTITHVSSEADSAFGYLIERWHERGEAINLLQGPYKAKKAESTDMGRWRAVAALGGIWVLVGVVGLIAQGFWASARADALEQRSEDLYRDIYPGEQRIINVQRQMRQKLGQRVAGAAERGFADYLGYLAQGIDRNASILSLNYTEARDELAADLLLRSYDELERLKQRVSQLGVEVEITSAEQQDTAVRARIRLKGA